MTQPSPELLSCSDLDIEIAGRVLVKSLNFSAHAGTVTCVLGRNGTGKTLTLHTLAGLRPASASPRFRGRELRTYARRDLARGLAIVPQDTPEAFPCSVLESVIVGRHPHIGFWEWESEHDVAIARAALAQVDLGGMEMRRIDTLSGGERRRLAIATTLTQEPQLFILDEPTNHLDPQHQLDILKLLRAKADAGCAVIMSLHDAGVAARFADQALLLFGDGAWLQGDSATVLNAENLTRLYGVPMIELRSPHGNTFIAA